MRGETSISTLWGALISVRQTEIFVSILLLVVLCLALVPASALGQSEADKKDEGETSESPHAAGGLIVTYEDGASEMEVLS